MSDIAATVIASLFATSVGSVIFPELPEAFKVGMGALIAALVLMPLKWLLDLRPGGPPPDQNDSSEDQDHDV